MRKPRPRTRLGRGARDLYNRPLLLIRGGHARYIPATGMCPWQTKRFCAKVVCNSVFGKFGVRDDVERLDIERELYCDTDKLADSISRDVGGPVVVDVVPPRVPFHVYRREWVAKDKPVVHYDICSSYPESMTRDFISLRDLPIEPLELHKLDAIDKSFPSVPSVEYNKRDVEILHKSLKNLCQEIASPSVFNTNPKPEDDHGRS